MIDQSNLDPRGEENQAISGKIGRFIKPVLLVCILIFRATLADAGPEDAGCDTGLSIRYLEGPKELLSRLRANAESSFPEIFFKKGEFHKEWFTYVGAVRAKRGGPRHVVDLNTLYLSSCRGANALLLFDGNEKYIGSYPGLLLKKARIDGSRLIIPGEAEFGNVMDLSSEPPPILHLDGDFYDFHPAIDAESPNSIARAYSLIDFQGDRLYSNMWDRYSRLVVWDKEPSWKGFRVIERYEIRSGRRSGKHASLEVRYTVAGDVQGGTWHPAGKAGRGSSGLAPREEIVRFELVKTQDGWKIERPRSMQPHVSVSGAQRYFSNTRIFSEDNPVLQALNAVSSKEAERKAQGK